MTKKQNGSPKPRQPEVSQPIPTEPVIPPSRAKKVAIHVLIILGAMALGFFGRFVSVNTRNGEFRLQNIASLWFSQPGYSYNGTPTLTTADAYYYTRYAREYLAGKYQAGKPDLYRDVVDSELPYPSPRPPLISILTAAISKVTGADVYQVAFYLPATLGILCVIPIYLVGLELSGRFVGFLGAVLGVTFNLYLVRSCLGRFDTDCLNLFFLFFIAYFLLLAWKQGRERITYLWSGLAGISMALFSWWYAHAGFLVIFLALFAFVLFVFRKDRQGVKVPPKLNAGKILIFVLLANPLSLIEGFGSLWGFVQNHIFLEVGSLGFPNILVSVSESTHFKIAETLRMIHSLPVGVVGLIGLIWLIIRTRSRFLLCLPILGLGLVAFSGGNRFAMFLAPFVGMGLGLLAEKIYALLIETRLKTSVTRSFALAGLVVASLGATVSPESIGFIPQPRFATSLARCLDAVRKLSSNGYVWTWWDWGYAIEDLADKATYTDGGSYRKAYFVGRSLATTQPAECRNTIVGMTRLGFDGLYKEMKKRNIKNPEPVLDDVTQGKFNFKPEKPLYLMFTDDMVGKFYWINYFGSWDFETQKGQEAPGLITEIPPIRSDGQTIQFRGGVIDLNRGVIQTYQQSIPLQKILVVSRDQAPREVRTFPNSGYICILTLADGNMLSMVYLVHPNVQDNVLVRMYLLKNYDPTLFELVYNDYPYSMIYRVK